MLICHHCKFGSREMVHRAFSAFALSEPLALPRNRPASLNSGKRNICAMTTSAKPLFAALCLDKPSSIARPATRPAHIEWANHPDTQVIFGGPLRDLPDSPPKGSLIIFHSDSLQTANQTLSKDPYAEAGLFESTQVRKWVMGMSSALPKDLFMVWCVDKPDSLDLRKETRPAHLDWWRGSGRKGIIGPFPCDGGAEGSLIVCEGKDVSDVREWAQTDPYNKVGLFESVSICGVSNGIDRVSPLHPS